MTLYEIDSRLDTTLGLHKTLFKIAVSTARIESFTGFFGSRVSGALAKELKLIPKKLWLEF